MEKLKQQRQMLAIEFEKEKQVNIGTMRSQHPA